MTILPIVGRELRVAARRRGTYAVRFVAAVLAILLATWVYVAIGDTNNNIGVRIFISLAVLAFLFCGLVGVINTADCVSEEKREGTLGLLFLTDLRGYDVILGKLAANSIHGFYGLVAIFPILAIPMLLGGIPVRSYYLLLIVLLVTLLLSLSAGIFISTLARDARRAGAGTLLLLLLIFMGGPALGLYLIAYEWIPTNGPPPVGFLVASPVYALGEVLELLQPRGGRFDTFYFRLSLALQGGLIIAFLGGAAFWIRHAWQDKPENERRQRRRGLWRRIVYGGPEYRAKWRARLMSDFPVLWLATRDRLRRYQVWGVLLLAGLGWLWGFLEEGEEWMIFPISICFLLPLHAILKVWLVSEACRQLGEDRRNGALELLLATPLRVSQVLRQLRLALRSQFGAPFAALGIIEGLLLVAALSVDTTGAEASLIISLFFAGMTMLALDYFALRWIGMWAGVIGRSFRHSTVMAVLRGLLLPWLIFVGSLVFFSVAWSFFERPWDIEGEHVILWWLMIGVAVDLGFMFHARSQLLGNLRALAAQPYGTTRGRWLERLRGDLVWGQRVGSGR